MQDVANPHSPEELAQLSTFIHNLAGWIFLVLAGLLIAEAIRGVPRSRWRLAWPGIGMVIGFGLTIWVFFHQWLYHQVSPFADPAQNQHQVIGLFTGVGAGLEFVRRLRNAERKLWRSAWPLAIVGVGAAFLIHEQGTVDALIVHWALAATFIVSGLGLLSVVLSGDESSSLRLFSILVLSTAALQLVFFAEKPGAHGSHPPAASTSDDRSSPTHPDGQDAPSAAPSSRPGEHSGH